MLAENKQIIIGDDVSNLKIYEIINKYFGEHYTGWMKAWYDINEEYAAWFPIITETNEKPSGDFGGAKSYSNTLSEDGKTILEINHDVSSLDASKQDSKYDKRTFVFGKIKGKYKFLGVFEKPQLVEETEKLTYKNVRIAVGADLETFKLIYDINDKPQGTTEWFISGNPSEYNIDGAFNELKKINWKQVRNYNVDDIVFLYISEGSQSIKYRCKITKTELPKPEIDDSKYNISGKYDGSFGKYIEIELLEKLEGSGFGRSHLEKMGFKSPQGPCKVTPVLSQYLNTMIRLQSKEEMNPDSHDGVYEAMRNTVKEYAMLQNISECNVADINFLFNLTGVPDSIGYEAKKAKIDSINLPLDAKERIKELLDRIQENVKNGQYNNHNENISFGIFRLPFKSFSYTSDDLAKKFLQACIDVYNEEDEDKCIEIVKEAFKDGIKGFQAAAASMILHCIKPMTFPIINGNEGRDNIYIALAIDVKNVKDLTSYADNCKKIKAFRDENFTFKNYRILDLESRNLVATSNTDINYLWLMDYLEKNRGVLYEKPDPTKMSADRIAELKDISTKGNAAVNELKKMVALCKEKFGLNIEKGKSIQWRDGSNTKTRDYLWAQMKYEAHADSPESISIFVDMSEVTEQARFRFSLEMRNDGANSQEKANHHKFLELPLDVEHGLVYVAGSNEYGRPELLNMSREEVVKKVNDGTIEKAQICRIIERDPELTNDKCEEIMLEGIGALIPYYEYVLGINNTQTEAFWPSQDEYPVDLTKDDWKRFIEEVESQHKGCMRVLKCYVDIGGTASPKRMSEVYKGHSMVYTGSISNTSRRALKYFNMKPCPDDKKPGTEWLFPIAFQGKKGFDNDSGYVYRMRPELMEALKEIDLSGIELEYRKGADEMSMGQFDKNLILYGPPGTGKTYNTAIYAVSICDNKPIESLTDYDAVMTRYNELKSEGRVAFTTFHQSYGYEEFIEGIKPIIGEENSDVGYRIEPGVFKRFCTNARKKTVTANKELPDVSGAKVWCVLLDGTGVSELKSQCFADNTIRIGWENWPGEITSTTEGLNDKVRRILLNFQDEMEVGDVVVVEKSNKSIDGIAVVTGEYEYNETEKWPRIRKVKWLMTGTEIDITELNGGKNLDRKSVYPLDRISAESILSLIDTQGDVTIEEEDRPYVFVIDEINRGNISKIFGELITLIEDTKREGMPEAASAKLPYSGENFSVPNNVYILGTMNTADRSIALMDTALRRRFQFEEKIPDAEVLRSIGADKVEDLDVALILEKINERITFLYDREHTIGHAFFTGLKDEPTVGKLASIFKKSVIPLLQEYFYEDYQKIQFVLGDNEKTSDNYKFILNTPIKATNIFKGSVTDSIDIPKEKYEINKNAFLEIESYKQIM